MAPEWPGPRTRAQNQSEPREEKDGIKFSQALLGRSLICPCPAVSASLGRGMIVTLSGRAMCAASEPRTTESIFREIRMKKHFRAAPAFRL